MEVTSSLVGTRFFARRARSARAGCPLSSPFRRPDAKQTRPGSSRQHNPHDDFLEQTPRFPLDDRPSSGNITHGRTGSRAYRTMNFCTRKSVAVALAAWHLVLAAAGYSLHAVTASCDSTATAAHSSCGCSGHQCGFAPTVTEEPDSRDGHRAGISSWHDPHACSLCRWLSQPQEPPLVASILVVSQLASCQRIDRPVAPVTRRHAAYGARAPPL